MNVISQSKLEKLREAIDWRLRGWLGDAPVDFPKIMAARLWRRWLKKTTFIGITGSVGKTTAKELLVGVLSGKGKVIGNPHSLNVLAEVAKLILRTRRGHDYCISEIGAPAMGSMDSPLNLFQPSIGVVTVIGDDHLSSYLSRGAIAREKGKLIDCVPPSGAAVLNADDDLVLGMAPRCVGKVITYGISSDADVRATNISATWPNRLAMTVAYRNQQVRVQSQLCGSHLATPALSAIATGLAAGLSLTECANGLASVSPFTGRMQPAFSGGGVTFIRDDFKAPLWTVDACLEFMSAAQAKRKIIVIGMLSEVGSKSSEKYAKVARRAQEIADITIFVGPWAFQALKAQQSGSAHTVHAFSHVHDASQYLNSFATDGDLVLLKGSNRHDHLFRMVLARTGDIACWRDDCQRNLFCDECPDRTKSSGTQLLQGTRAATDEHESASESLFIQTNAVAPDEQIIVGLGNHESRYSGTPHNVGYEAVDHIATSLKLSWRSYADAWIARGVNEGKPICLVKIRTDINNTGLGLKRLSDDLSFRPEQCVILFDDLDMPLGAVRMRLSGGAAGHRGVASILQSFQTDRFRRVKIGVGQPNGKLKRAEYLLTAFDPSARLLADQAVIVAGIRALELTTRTDVIAST